MAITKVTRTLLSTGIVDNSNATAITIDSSENVGIGTSSPSAKLHITGDTGIRVNNSANTQQFDLKAQGSNLGIENFFGSGSTITLGTNANGGGVTERMRIDSSGNVGIGAKLYSNSPVSTLGGFQFYREHTNGDCFVFDTTTAPYAGDLIFGTTNTERMRIDSSGNVITGSTTANNSAAVTLRQDGTAHVNNVQVANGGGSAGGTTPSIYSPASATLAISTNSSERMRIDGSGNVGIGTSDPKEFCDINGGGLIVRGALTNGVDSGNGLRFEHTSDIGQIYSLEPNVAWRELRLNASQQTFYIAGGEKMRIDSSGRVMVNQTAASAASAGVKMQVNTDILSRGTFAGYFWENRSGITIGSLTGWGGWYSTGTSVHSLYSDGNNIVSINRSSGAYTALSDKNKKKDFEDSTVGLTEVMQLQPKKFRMIDDADDAPKKLGFVAQDVENIIPEAYFEDTNEDASGVESTFIGLTDRPIIAALTKAIQEQQTIIDDLKTRIETLESA
jgi:hypothetical protein